MSGLGRHLAAVAVVGILAAAPPAAADTALRVAQADAEPLVVQALAEIERIEGLAAALAPGDVATANRYLGELRGVGNRLNAAANKGHPKWGEARTRFNDLNQRIAATARQPAAAGGSGAPSSSPAAPPRLISSDQARLNRTSGAIRSLGQQVQGASFQTFLDEHELARSRDAAASHRATLDGFPAEHPDVAAARTALAEVEKAIEARLGEARATLASVGDPDAQLADIDRRLQETKVPAPEAFKPDQGPQAAAAHVGTLVALRRQAGIDKATLDKLKAAGFKDDRIGRLSHWAVDTRLRQIDESYETARRAVEAHVDRYLQVAAFQAATDPNDRDHRANRLLGDGRYEATLAEFAAGAQAVETAAALDAAAGRTGGPDRAAQGRTLAEARAGFETKYRTALTASRMPAAGMTDATYLTVAREVLADPAYKLPPHRRLVINSSRVQRKEKHEGEIRPGTVSATVTVYHWEWDEYQVATAERDGDHHYVFYNTLKFFHRGAPTTPTQRWLLADRFKGEKILEENIDK